MKITIDGEHFELFDRQAIALSPGESDLSTCAEYGDDPQDKTLVVEVNPRTETQSGRARVCVSHKVVRSKGEIIEAEYQLTGTQVTGEFLLYFRDVQGKKGCQADPPENCHLTVKKLPKA